MNPKRNEATEKFLQKQRALDVLCSIDRNPADREYSRVEDIWLGGVEEEASWGHIMWCPEV